MAIQWPGGGARADYANPGDLNTGPFTFACRCWLQSPPQSGNQYFIAIKDAAAALGFIVWFRDAGTTSSIAVSHNASGTNRFRDTVPIDATINAPGWHTLVVRGTASLAASGIGIRLDGSEPGYDTTQDGTGTFPALTGTMSVAGRDTDNARNLVARTAGMVLARRLWTDQEVQAYEAGLPAEFVQPADIIYDARFLNGSTLDRISDSPGTVNGAPVAFAQPNHVAALGAALSLVGSSADAANASPVSDDRFAAVTSALAAPVSSADVENVAPVLVATTMTDEYEGGNSDVLRAVITDASSLTPNVRMWARPGVNTEGGSPSEIYFTAAWRLDGVLNKTPSMELSLSDPLLIYGAGGFPAGWRLWYTYDHPEDLDATWLRCANTSVSGGFQQMSHNAPFTQDRVYFATRPEYGNTKLRAWLDSKLPSVLIKEPPSSAGNNFAYGQSAATTRDGDGLAVPALNLFSLLIEDDSLQPPDGSPKRTWVWFGRQHPSEMQGSWILQGSLNRILDGSAAATEFLTYNRVYCYPMINASGVWGNAYRGTLQSGERDQDPNRDWPGGATAGRLDVVSLTRAAVTLDTQNAIAGLLDYHGRGSFDNSYFLRESAFDNQAFFNRLNAVYPTVEVPVGDGTPGVAPRYYGVTHNVRIHGTPEGDGILANGVQGLDEFRLFGEAFIDAINASRVAGDMPVRGASAGAAFAPPGSLAETTNVNAPVTARFADIDSALPLVRQGLGVSNQPAANPNRDAAFATVLPFFMQQCSADNGIDVVATPAARRAKAPVRSRRKLAVVDTRTK